MLDGKGYKISRMKLKVYWADGAFITDNYGTVENLSFENTDAYFETPVDATTCAIVVANNMGEIINCHTYGGKISYYAESQQCADSVGYTDLYIGNIVGMNEGGLISGCSAKVGISGLFRSNNYKSHTCIGGLVAQMDGGDITDSYAELTLAPSSNYVSGGNYHNESYYRIGGLVGEMVSGKIEKSYANCTISNNYRNVYNDGHGECGGFIGAIWGGAIDQCYSLGSISLNDRRGVSNTGGFVGRMLNDSNSITNSYSSTSVYCTGLYTGFHLGSFGGYVMGGDIKNCYTTGSISLNASGFTGSFVSRLDGGSIKNCMSTLTGGFSTDGGTKENNANANDYTLEELKSESFIYGKLKFDRKIWIADGINMPILAWQTESEE